MNSAATICMQRSVSAEVVSSGAVTRTLSESDSKALLAPSGVPFAPERVVSDPAAAASAASEFGFPVVAKISSPDIAHKTEVGGVWLNLASEADVRDAASAILASARRLAPEARIDGVSIQAHVPPGVELVLGLRIDAQFGPLIVAGLGGIMVELLGDVATRIAPVGPAGALRMLQSLRGFPLLAGFRGKAPVDLDAAVDAVCRLSELAADLADMIDEADINPLIVGANGAVAADALIVLADRTHA